MSFLFKSPSFLLSPIHLPSFLYLSASNSELLAYLLSLKSYFSGNVIGSLWFILLRNKMVKLLTKITNLIYFRHGGSRSLIWEFLIPELKLLNPVLNCLFYPCYLAKLAHWKRLRCWERLKAGEGDDRGWVGWMASLTQWTWVWASSRSWLWTRKPCML